ncbi:unnamed protein product [Peronospora belbahrii]|uniref:Uncharacterized protein n=1 Tax=Peronospora belbahrii TaxID=622444 RepID=A0ABN8CR63_9STRA|nr:unnamed protein product [Peronospora belbahrii]
MGDLTKESYIHDVYTTAKSVKKGEQLSISIDVDAIVMGLGLIITGALVPSMLLSLYGIHARSPVLPLSWSAVCFHVCRVPTQKFKLPDPTTVRHS